MGSPNAIHSVRLHWEHRPYLAFVIENLFTKEECDALISRSEQEGYEEALVNIGGGHQMKMNDMRNSDRCIIDDPEVAQDIWQRVMQVLDSVQNLQAENTVQSLNLEKLLVPERGWTAVGLNERLRILRYGPGTFFKPHCDGSYVRGKEAGKPRQGEKSFVTCQLYLNQGCEGGETRFLSSCGQKEFKVVPKTGSVLLFQHDLIHEGCPVSVGKKYVVRTDVLYTQRGPGHEYCREPIVLRPSASDSFEFIEES